MDLLISWSILVLTVYQWVIIACMIIGFFPEFQNNEFAKILSRMVDPFLMIFRKFVPTIAGWDLSIMVALLALHFAIRGLSGW